MRLNISGIAGVAGSLVVFLAEVAWGTVVAGPLTHNDHQYYLVDQGDLGSWTRLEAEAVSLGGHLVTINDAAENEWIRSTFPAYGRHNMWIGLNDLAVDGVFQWVSGEPVTYTNWAPGEPGPPDGTSPFVGMTYVDGLWGDRSWGSVRGVVEVVPEPSTTLLVSSQNTDSVLRYDGQSGAFIDAFVPSGSGGLDAPIGLVFGPDGSLYVGSAQNNSVLRYNGQTGVFIDAFVPTGSGGLASPVGLVFGPDSNLYVASQGNNSVLRYNGQTGVFIDAFVTTGSGGLIAPFGLVFGPDSNLYVASQGNSSVLRFDGQTGAFIDSFVPLVGGGGSGGPRAMVFGSDGNLYLTASNFVARFDGQTGASIDCFADSSTGLDVPIGLVFGPDGNLYIANFIQDEVLRYDAQTGDRIDAFVPTGSGGLDVPWFLIFDNDGDFDGVANSLDNCPFVSNTAQTDSDSDSIGDACDDCPQLANPGQEDCNGNGVGDICDIAAGASQDCNTNGVPDECDIAAGMHPQNMVLIAAGEFQMGDTFNEWYTWERPVHAVYVNAFYMDTYDVANQEYAAGLNWAYAQGGLITVTGGVVYKYASGTSYPYCDTTTSTSESRITWDGTTFGVVSGKESHPMVRVSWYGSVAYCNWRSAMEGKPLCYDLSAWTCNWGSGYRLPTEAEWERAARGGVTGHRFPWSDTGTIQHARANYNSSSAYSYDTSPTRGYHPTFNTGGIPYTSPVGYFAPNGYGLYDMAGNVWQWCNDWWSETYYSSSPYSNPHGPASGSYRVFRGGSWFVTADFCRCASRSYGATPGTRYYDVGFRLTFPRGTSNDCNGNAIPDECDLTSGISNDLNSNGIPDECDAVPGDLDSDGDVDADDFAVFLASWGRCSGDAEFNADADFDGDGCITIVDYQIWLQHYRDYVGNPLASPPIGTRGDFDSDGDVDLVDFANLQGCIPAPPERALPCNVKFDFDGDRKVDLGDLAGFEAALTGP